MKKKYLLIEFILVLVLLVLPPLVIHNTGNTALKFTVTWGTAIQIAWAAILQLQWRIVAPDTTASSSGKKDSLVVKTFTILKWAPLTLGLLMLVYAALLYISIKFPAVSAQENNAVFAPVTAIQWVLAAIQIAAAAFFEESLYRSFLPQCLELLLPPKKQLRILAEILVLAVFAFSHRYLGAMAVINAALCGAILRLCCIKTKGIATGTAVHFAYNLILLVFSSL